MSRGNTKFLSVKEAAQKWGVSERLVQKYCASGDIAKAEKCSGAWKIPVGAKLPEKVRNGRRMDVRKVPVNISDTDSCLMPLMNSAFQPGKCLEYIAGMKNGSKKNIAVAEYYYFSGNPEKAMEKSGEYLKDSNPEISLSAHLIYAYAGLSVGEIEKVRDILEEVRQMLAEKESVLPELEAAKAFIAVTADVLLHRKPSVEGRSAQKDYLLLPPGLRAFALYVHAHYLYLQGEYGTSLGITEATLAMQIRIYPIPSIYLHLLAVMDYMSLRQPEPAQAHLLEAWKLAQPDDLIESFGEHHGLLGGMLEAVIKKEWPEEFKRIINITYRFSEGWRKIHNPDTGHDVADNLTTTEFATAMLASRGWTNQEIADHFGISVNTVKKYISSILHKLNIEQRQNIKKYMLR